MITPDDIAQYKQYNKLCDRIRRADEMLGRVELKCFKHRETLQDSIAKETAERDEIAVGMVERLGPNWAVRCVEYMIGQPETFETMLQRLNGDNEKAHANRLIFGDGVNFFEIKRVERGMDGRTEG